MGFDRNAASDQAFGHKPVLLEECLTALDIKPDGIYVDGTLGRAGHSLEIVKKLTGNGRLICLDRDETAIEAAKIRLADYLDRVTLVHSNFSRIAEVLHELDIPGVDGMLFDLGVSSPQLDEAQRGFSYMHDAPLDMRMDRTAALTARDVVSFQAIRIAVNDELGELRPMLQAASDALRPGGRLAVISFHSLEDRIIKKTLQELSTGCTCPPNFPVCVCGKKPKMKLVGRKPIVAGEAELVYNPRARSAKLRVAEKL